MIPSATPRREADRVEILSGVFEGKTTGTTISLLIRNSDAASAAYEGLKDLYRPGHGDITYQAKYGIRDHRGGGRASARETAGRVAAGAVAKKVIGRGGDHGSGLDGGTGRHRCPRGVAGRRRGKSAALPRSVRRKPHARPPGAGAGSRGHTRRDRRDQRPRLPRQAWGSPSSGRSTQIWQAPSWGSAPSRGWRSARGLPRQG